MIKINNFRGELSDISAKKTALVDYRWFCHRRNIGQVTPRIFCFHYLKKKKHRFWIEVSKKIKMKAQTLQTCGGKILLLPRTSATALGLSKKG